MSAPLHPPKVLALGGAGMRIATRLLAAESHGLQSFSLTGLDLGSASAPFPVLPLGCSAFQILGSGGDSEVVLQAAQEKRHELQALVADTPLVFLIAGLGGATGSALAHFLAQLAAASLVVAFVGLPFSVEGARRAALARETLAKLKSTGALVIPLPGDTFQHMCGGDTAQALSLIDTVLARGIRAVAGAIYSPGLTEIDFARLRDTLCQAKGGKTLFAYAQAQGEHAFAELFNELTGCPVLQAPEMARNADHLLLSLKVSPDVGLKEIDQLAHQLCEKFGIRGERFIGALIEPQWPATRLEAVMIALTDPELRRRQQALLASAQPARGTRLKDRDKDADKDRNKDQNFDKAGDKNQERDKDRNREKDKDKEKAASAQIEFLFNRPSEQRGIFETTPANLYRGEDIDVPTYLRRGIKINL